MDPLAAAPLGWAVLKPTEIRLRFQHEGHMYTLRANLIIRPYAPLALRQLEILEWTIEPPRQQSDPPEPPTSDS